MRRSREGHIASCWHAMVNGGYGCEWHSAKRRVRWRRSASAALGRRRLILITTPSHQVCAIRGGVRHWQQACCFLLVARSS